ncbi:alpha/beta hydrolase family protein [Hymenobacter artigasi]|uniref:Pimeloyl-ACP methyl ester carboxylesterase n=1 Tax=Hymenobacter artigasi TaxID=2719616 RepID=A0ABX1HNP1_9BACT|nr:chlorophyllase [Hymenobacter artigasi]NKI91846.1 pimeloyl-ACP methyl ester carboxylesterase [Hymenobacter artigasi]
MRPSTPSPFDSLTSAPSAVISVSPIILAAPDRGEDLQVRVSAPVIGSQLPLIILAHGFGSSLEGYAPLAQFWAAHGFAVIQPTFLDSRTLQPKPKASHGEAVQAYLADPRKLRMWRFRVADMKRILDHLDVLESAVPGLTGRLDHSRIAVAGHSFGAQTAGVLLGARVLGADESVREDLSDPRIKAGVLLSAAGQGGESLSPFAVEHFPHLNQSYADLKTPTLVVAGDADQSPLTVRGPEWFTDAYTLSPGANCLVTLFGGEHMLGGISGYLVTETTDENPERVAVVQWLTWAYLRSALYPEDPAWPAACATLQERFSTVGRIDCK